MKKENWIKEFNKIAPATLEIEGYVCDLRPVMLKVKSFIHQTRKEAFEEADDHFASVLAGLNLCEKCRKLNKLTLCPKKK